uniref:Uncharacterized protein n=1 Tax=Eutreptiella gymnastica TaxID=73025 RepID=A0A7S1J9B6_9EUGL
MLLIPVHMPQRASLATGVVVLCGQGGGGRLHGACATDEAHPHRWLQTEPLAPKSAVCKRNSREFVCKWGGGQRGATSLQLAGGHCLPTGLRGGAVFECSAGRDCPDFRTQCSLAASYTGYEGYYTGYRGCGVGLAMDGRPKGQMAGRG